MYKSNAAEVIELATIFQLPESTDVFRVAAACRDAALAFLNESAGWGKGELAMWLMGPYSLLSRYATHRNPKQSGEYARPVLAREIDASSVDKMIVRARAEVLATLRGLNNPEAEASFGFDMLASGFVARCEDAHGNLGFLPSTEPRRLVERVQSLIGAYTLTFPSKHNGLSVCGRCQNVDFDTSSCGVCGQDPSAFSARPTLPYRFA